MSGLGRVWDIACVPFQWISQMPFGLHLWLLFFGFAMTPFAKRNQKGLVFSISVAMTVLLAVAWVNSRVPLAAHMLRALQKMPLWSRLLAVVAASVVFGVVAARAASFTHIKMNRFIALAERCGHFTFSPHISEVMVRLRCIIGESLYWMVEAGMMFGLTRCPHPFRAELPQAFVQPPLWFIVRGMFGVEVLCAAIAVAGAGGVVAMLFRACLRKQGLKISATSVPRMIVYLVMIVFSPVSRAIQLAVAYATALGLSDWYARMGYCRPRDCVPRFWFPMEERRCLLCGFAGAAEIRAEGRTVVSREELRTLKCIHVLTAQDDDLFLRSGLARDALWRMRFGEGDTIVVCARCRKVFFSEDFSDSCPLCASDSKLWFSHPAALLMRGKTVLHGGVTLERPYETTLLRCEEDRQGRAHDGPSPGEHPFWLLMPAAVYVAVLLTCA